VTHLVLGNTAIDDYGNHLPSDIELDIEPLSWSVGAAITAVQGDIQMLVVKHGVNQSSKAVWFW